MTGERSKAARNSCGAEPLLPIEKKLIGWFVGLGITILIAFAVAERFFPAR